MDKVQYVAREVGIGGNSGVFSIGNNSGYVWEGINGRMGGVL